MMLLKILGRFQGVLGEIAVLESEKTGERLYREGEIFQSQSSASGESRLPYVKMMRAFLDDAESVLLLGCGGGNLATMLARSGKSTVVVDCNPVSFKIAREFFGMPKDIPCILQDFREYLKTATRRFDGIAIDVGGPGFCYEQQFDLETCRLIAARLNPRGRSILNMVISNDFDGAPEKIGSCFSEVQFDTWIFDQPGCQNRNVLLTCMPRPGGARDQEYIATFAKTVGRRWTIRRARTPSPDTQPVHINITC